MRCGFTPCRSPHPYLTYDLFAGVTKLFVSSERGGSAFSGCFPVNRKRTSSRAIHSSSVPEEDGVPGFDTCDNRGAVAEEEATPSEGSSGGKRSTEESDAFPMTPLGRTPACTQRFISSCHRTFPRIPRASGSSC